MRSHEYFFPKMQKKKTISHLESERLTPSPSQLGRRPYRKVYAFTAEEKRKREAEWRSYDVNKANFTIC